VSSKSDIQNNIKKRNFYRDGKLKKTLEYVNVCEKEYLNQGWYFNENRDTIEKKTHFCKIKIHKKSLKPEELSKVSMTYKPLLKNSVSAVLLSKENDLSYCDLENKKFDTLYFVDNKLQYLQSFKSAGNKKLTGYVLEITKELRKDGTYDERKIYFTLNFKVQ